jgi:deazaflavin-dependent oxidoreductase (nitroreductase family)
MNSTMQNARSHYLAPDWATRRIMNPIVGGLVKLGVSVKGAGILSVRGRKSGEWRSTPVNPLTLDGERYLVAPRGETQWVRNLREAGGGRLRQGRRQQDFTAVEIDDSDKTRVLRAYLKEWAWEVGKFFDGVGADATDDELAAIAPRHPVFRIVEA